MRGVWRDRVNAIEMVGRCMIRQDPNIPPAIPAGFTFEEAEGHTDSLARVADEGIVEGVRAIQVEPARNDAGEVIP